MSTSVTIGNETFEYPNAGDSPGWGEDASGAFIALADQVNLINNVNDILETAFIIGNNVASFTNITPMIFNTSTVRAVEVDFSIYRTSSTEELVESGTMTLTYKNTANEWGVSMTSSGDDAGVTFNVTNAGQVQYTSTNVSGTSYSGVLRFRAKTILQ